MRTLNLGILAHVDAGKTSLTERLLHGAGVIDELGSVDAGSTATDTLALERQRGITIRSAVVSFVVDDVVVNLIDTPGHPDFIAEVERVLGVLDGCVLVVSAVEGVQPQTRVLMRALRRLRVPTLVFVNKLDRAGARPQELPRELADRLGIAVVAMDRPVGAVALETLAEHDEGLLAAYVDGTAVASPRLRTALARQSRRGLVHPVFFGSAITGAGVDALTAGLTDLLPATARDPEAALSGTVFKVDRGPAGQHLAYASITAGTVRTRDRIRYGAAGTATVTTVAVFDHGGTVPTAAAGPGRIALLGGLAGVRIGDALRSTDGPADRPAATWHFPPPTLETVVAPCRPADRAALHAALDRLAEQDPLINLRRDDRRAEIAVSLYGEVQKEVLAATLADDFGVPARFAPSTTICVERVVGTGAAVEVIAKPPNPFLATVGLRVEPAAPGSGVRFRLAPDRLGTLPRAFRVAVEETVTETLGQGLRGWAVQDCVVTMTHTGYYARQSHAHGSFDKSMSSTAGDFRNLTPLVLTTALRRAGTRVHEPVHRFRLDLPLAAVPAVLSALDRLGGIPTTQRPEAGAYRIDGTIPADRVHALQQQLPRLSSGEGELETAFDHYRAVRGAPPARARTDHNPLDRREYLLRVTGRWG